MNSELVHQQQELAKAICSNATLTSNLLKPTPQGSPARLNIYSIAYRSRLGESLKENYPILARVLGDDAFVELANAFLDHYPSSTPSIRWYGTALADFTIEHADALQHPCLTDLIRMEWALNIAFDAADAEPLQVSDLMAVQPDEWPALQFEPHASLQLLAMNWNIAPLWSALSADENAEADPPEELQHHLLIWRLGYTTQYRSVETIEAQLLQAMLDGCSFAELCEIAAQTDPQNAAQTVAGYLRIWVEAGLLISVCADSAS